MSDAVESSDAAEAARIDDAESQMRKALGLLGEAPRHRSEPERAEQSHRMPDRFGAASHRRRFVQDGDVPVTVLRRDTHHDAAALPTSSRLQRVEAALAAETSARERAERLLTESQSLVRDLQTKIGHAELARADAAEALRQEREAAAKLRHDAAGWQEQLDELATQLRSAETALHAAHEQLHEEQRARRAAEKALKAAEAARDSADKIVRSLTQDTPVPAPAAPAPAAPSQVVSTWAPPVRRLSESASISPAIRRRRAAEPTVAEQEPVKWWLAVKPAGKRK